MKLLNVFLVLSMAAGSHAVAQSPAVAEKDIRFQNGSVELAGTFVSPRTGTRFPAVVFLHGSGPSTRAGARPYAEEFAKMGIASLIFDKRGSGASGGSWVSSSLDDLAGDALAAVSYLKTLGNVDSSRIGLWGVSQAGWVETLAASQSPDIAFMIVISGGGASPRESEFFSYKQEFDKAGLSDSEQSQAFDLVGAYFKYLATGKGRSRVAALLEGTNGRLSPLAKQLTRILPSEENRTNWSWVATWNPSQSIEKITCPVLLMFGDKDTEHPTQLAVQKWKMGLKKAGNKNVTVVVFPGAGHGIRMREGFSGKGRPPFADGYSEVMLGWLWQHVVMGE